MPILKLEDVVLQNNGLFVYNQIKIASQPLLIIIFTKLQTTIVTIQDVKNLTHLLPKLQPMAFNQLHQL